MIVRDKNGVVIAKSADGVTWERMAAGEAAVVEIANEEAALFGEVLNREPAAPPRCAMCRWVVGDDRLLTCGKMEDETQLAHADHGVVLVTPDFGCVMWEAKP